VTSRRSPYVIDAVEQFLGLKEQRRPKTYAAFSTLLKGSDRGTKPALGVAFASYFQGRRMSSLTADEVSAWFAQRSRNAADATKHRFSKNAREFIRFAIRRGYCETALEDAVLRHDPGSGRVVWLEWSEVHRLLASIPEFRLRMAVAWIFFTGCRVAEAVSAVQHEVEFKNEGRLYFWTIPVTKTKHPRGVWLTEALNPYLEQSRLENKPRATWPVLWDCEGRGYARVESPAAPISPRMINIAIERACQEAGILKHVTAHVARHTYCTNWLNSVGDGERDLHKLSRQVGCSVDRLRKTYIHFADDDQAFEAIRNLGSPR